MWGSRSAIITHTKHERIHNLAFDQPCLLKGNPPKDLTWLRTCQQFHLGPRHNHSLQLAAPKLTPLGRSANCPARKRQLPGARRSRQPEKAPKKAKQHFIAALLELLSRSTAAQCKIVQGDVQWQAADDDLRLDYHHHFGRKAGWRKTSHLLSFGLRSCLSDGAEQQISAPRAWQSKLIIASGL